MVPFRPLCPGPGFSPDGKEAEWQTIPDGELGPLFRELGLRAPRGRSGEEKTVVPGPRLMLILELSVL